MEPTEEAEELKFSQLEEILKEHEFNETDLENLKKKKFDQVSDAAKEILQNLGITEEDIENALKTEKPKELEKPKKPKEERKKSDDVEKKKPPTTREEIESFLREKSLSQSFVATFLKVGFTEEVQRLLYAMGYTCEDTEELRRLWRLESKNREEIDSLPPTPSSSNGYLSYDGLYLKYSLSKPLSHAIREIVARKPFDPIEYLGHWLLNYKICEEREKMRKEFELELMIERERLKHLTQEEEMPVSLEEEDREEEEEFVDTWSILNDE